MPVTAQSLVTAIKDDFGFEYGRAVILDYLRRVVNKLCNQNVEQMVYRNGSDTSFPYPILNTTADTLDYEITSSNLVDSDGSAISLAVGGSPVVCRKINYVFIVGTNLRNSSYDRITISGTNAFWAEGLTNATFYKYPVSIYDRTSLKNPHVQFLSDPGTHDDRYYVNFYWGALELTSESIPLSLDGDVWEEALMEGTVGLIEKVENGRSARWDRFETYHMKKFITSMNKGMEEQVPLQMPIRECG